MKMNKMTEQKKPRLKFSRLCLSQNRNLESIGTTNSQPQSSQISKFFLNRNTGNECTDMSKANPVENDVRSNTEPTTIVKYNNETIKISENPLDDRQIPSTSKTLKSKKQKTETGNSIKSFFGNENNDSLADFDIPTNAVKKVPKIQPIKSQKMTRKRTKQSDIRKVLSKYEANSDYSHLPEDAQVELALALSRSDSDSAKNNPSVGSINLEKYQSSKSTGAIGLDFFNIKRKTAIKHKWNAKCTQLTRRQDEIQRSKINQKIDELLCDNITFEARATKITPESIDVGIFENYEVFSEKLQRICMPERILYEINACNKDIRNNYASFYTNNLVEIQWIEAGALLRDWSKIPGRDGIFDGIRDKTETEEPMEIDDLVVVSSESGPFDEEQQHIDVEQQNDEKPEKMNITDLPQQSRPSEGENIEKTIDILESDSSQNDINATDDEDRTIIVDSDEIQLQVEEINTKIRLSQNFADVFNPVVVEHERTNALRCPSPDLFDDDDDDDDDDDINGIQIDENKKTNDAERNDVDEIKALASTDVISISSSGCELSNASNPTACDNDMEKVKSFVDDIIELSDDPSTEYEFKENSQPMPPMSENPENDQFSNSEHFDSPNAVPTIKKHSENDDDDDDDDDFDKLVNLIKESNDHQNNTNDSSLTPTITTKKLSFTERLKLYEEDFENGFTANIQIDHLDRDRLSQESITLSDDEINYSMIADHKRNPNESSKGVDEDDISIVIDPIEFDKNDHMPTAETEERLVNNSVCNIFERTFEKASGSPLVSQRIKPKSSFSKTLKKINSETVFTGRSTSPKKKTQPFNEYHVLPATSQSSQSKNDAPMDLSDENYIIRVGSVSPKPNYEKMDTIALETELRKFGLKPSLRKRQAIICLDYIYNRTHPFMLNDSPENGSAPVKAGKSNEPGTSVQKRSHESQLNFNIGFGAHNLVDEKFKQSKIDQIYLPSWPRAKKPWCLIPLHIAWHNLITANKELKKYVVTYEPIDLLELRKFFKSIDILYDNRDLIAFLDQHCITFRMNKKSKE